MNLEHALDELLKRGVADWIDAGEVAHVARSVGGAQTEAEIQALSLELVRAVLEHGLMTIGEVSENGFHPWTKPISEVLPSVAREWRGLGRGLLIGELFWLSNTASGDARGNELLGG